MIWAIDVQLILPTMVIPAVLSTAVIISLMWLAEHPAWKRRQTRLQVSSVKTPLFVR